MSSNAEQIVVALGGNAISVPGEQGNIEEQFAQSRKTAKVLCDAMDAGHRLVLTHGNGPQVGSILRRVEIASRELYPIPLEVCVADTQAGMGYMIAQSIMNECNARQQQRDVTTLVTTVEVDQRDAAFETPSKPIGPRLTEVDALEHQREDGWQLVKLEDNVYRRVVPCPIPQRILEFQTIEKLAAAGELVICCGGGGIPVFRDANGNYLGAAAVIDKDRTTALLARKLGVKTMVILTGVDQVCLNFNRSDEQPLDSITIEEARDHLAAGHFGSGSMAPKVEAAIEFVSRSSEPDAVAVIAGLFNLVDALAGKSGTRVVRR